MSTIANEALEVHVREVKKTLLDRYKASSSPEDKFALNTAVSLINSLNAELEMRVSQLKPHYSRM